MLTHPLFLQWPMPQLKTEDIDQAYVASMQEKIVVFFWGHQCPNCEIAKRMILEEIKTYREFPLRWFHVNTSEEPELGTRFGLHGIPTFLFFHNGKTIGKATSFPGHQDFIEILNKINRK